MGCRLFLSVQESLMVYRRKMLPNCLKNAIWLCTNPRNGEGTPIRFIGNRETMKCCGSAVTPNDLFFAALLLRFAEQPWKFRGCFVII